MALTPDEQLEIDARRRAHGLPPIYGVPRPATSDEIVSALSAGTADRTPWVSDGWLVWQPVRRPQAH